VFPTFVDELEARTRIQDVLYRHSRGIDRNDQLGDRAAAYHPDAWVDSGAGRQPVADLLTLRRREHDRTRHTMHSVTNVLIEFASPDVAAVESHVTAVEWEEAGYDFASRGITDAGPCGARILSWCRYLDIFERRSGEWRILDRTVVFGDTTHEPLPVDPVLPQRFQVQQHGAGDPVYVLAERARALVEHRWTPADAHPAE
jgi:hypothetical protein